jgi:hypothetical protein
VVPHPTPHSPAPLCSSQLCEELLLRTLGEQHGVPLMRQHAPPLLPPPHPLAPPAASAAAGALELQPGGAADRLTLAAQAHGVHDQPIGDEHEPQLAGTSGVAATSAGPDSGHGNRKPAATFSLGDEEEEEEGGRGTS